MEIELNEPRQQIDYNQQNALQYTGPPVHNTSQQAITYNSQKALPYNEASINNTSQKAITYNPPKMLHHILKHQSIIHHKKL